MAVLYQSPDLQLPWSSSDREDRKFYIIALILLFIVLIGGVIVQNTTLPEIDREKAEKLPPQLAKVILKKKEKPKPKPKPKPQPEKKPEEKKPEPKKEKPKPKKEDVKKAREKAKKSGLLKMQDELASMRQMFKPQQNKALTKSGAKATEVKRSVIVGAATNTSGGIQTDALPTTSGIASLDGREVTQVDSVTLGGTVVDTGDGESGESGGGGSASRSEESIRYSIEPHKGSLFNIYNRALRDDPTLEGNITFELVIEPDGTVSSCKILSSDMEYPDMEDKLVARIKLIDFGPEDVATTVYKWTINFFPQ